MVRLVVGFAEYVVRRHLKTAGDTWRHFKTGEGRVVLANQMSGDVYLEWSHTKLLDTRHLVPQKAEFYVIFFMLRGGV